MSRKLKHPSRRPILNVYTTAIDQHRGANTSVCIEFRFQEDGDDGRLSSYCYTSFEQAGGIYYNLICRFSIDGQPQKNYNDEVDGYLLDLRYDSVHNLKEQKLSEMLKTLKRINRRLDAIERKEGYTTKLSEYARRVAQVVKAKEMVIENSFFSIEEGIVKIDDLIREQRRKCLEITGNMEELVQNWCVHNGYSEPSHVDGTWWAFPRGRVMQICIDELLQI